MTKLGYPLLPVIERAEFSLFDRPSGSKDTSRIAKALGVLIVLCLLVLICFIGFTALTIGVPGTKHSTPAPESWPPSVVQGANPGLRGQSANGVLVENRPDLTALSTNSSTVPEAPKPAVAPVSTPPSGPRQTDETTAIVGKESDAPVQPAEGRRARLMKMNHSQPVAAGARKLGKEKHKKGIAHKHRETNLASDGTTSGK
jgi:hypothetical protein